MPKTDDGFFIKTDTAHVPTTEYSRTFIQAMVDRMHMSFFKYGPVAKGYPAKVDALKSLMQRLIKYAGPERIRAAVERAIDSLTPNELKAIGNGDGNTEWLVDGGNFCQIEYMRPSHPKAHFKGTDSRESPGRVTTVGVVTSKQNTDLK